MEDILISASNGTFKQPSEKIMEIYSSVINFDKPMNQLSMLQDFVRVSTTSQRIKKITKVSTICEVMNSSNLGKSMFEFTEVHKLLTIYLTVPMTSGTAERIFSSLRRLKNYLRSTMTQKRLNNVVLMHTHKECTAYKVNLLSIAKDFVTSNESHANYFEQY